MLRAYTTERGCDFDVDAEFLKRSKLLEKRQIRPSVSLGCVGLARKLFPSWNQSIAFQSKLSETIEWIAAPKATKNAYEAFLKVF